MDPMLPSVITSIIPILIGGVSAHYRLFIESPKDFRDRIRLKKQSLIEQHALRHTELLQYFRSIIGTDNVLRGDGKEARDFPGDFSSDTFRLSVIFFRLELLLWMVHIAFFCMLLSIVLGIAGALIAWLVEPARRVVLITAIVTIAVQMGLVVMVYFSSKKLEGYEDVA